MAFHDEAVIECEEEGSVLYIWTWYIDHQAFRHCPEPKIVRIGSARHEWPEKIYEPWLSLLNPRAVTNVAVVHAIPPHDALRIETLHIMIEQNPLEPRAAAVLSAIFHEAAANRLLQAAYSLPRWLCTEDIIDFLQLNPICEIQRCSARAGRIPFEQFVRHDIPSALSIELHVRPVRCLGDDEAASSAEPFVPRPLLPTTGRSLMQVSRRWQRHRQFQQHDEPPPPQEHLSDEHHDVPNRVSACASHPTPQLPLMAPVWPTPWTALEEVWTFYFANQMQHPDTQITAEVWYSDHLRRPWSDSGRTVALGVDFTQWISRLLNVWSDWILPGIPYDIVVVCPTPLGANDGIHFHVMILQQPQPTSKSILLTVMDQYTDPWAPGLISIVVPNAIDHWMLLHCAVVEFQCPPAVPHTRCYSFWGNTDLTAGNLFPVRHGMCFTVTVESAANPGDADPVAHDEQFGPATPEVTSLLQLRATYGRVHRVTAMLKQQATDLQSTLEKAYSLAFLVVRRCSLPTGGARAPAPPVERIGRSHRQVCLGQRAL